ncbi:MAG TPA: hypothetical protein VN700_14340 [Vicinamibacterales bacterium]|nr:hypothetical protein [Vicinamibacterales bacterium]
MTAFFRSNLTRNLVFAVVCGAAVLAMPARPSAQTASSQPATSDKSAEDVREQFYAVLRQYSPSLGQILRLDPNLMTREDYMTAYPAVSAFVKQHPEIVRNPSYYLSKYSNNSEYYSYYDPRERAWNNTMEMMGVFFIFLTVAGALGWLVRTAIDYRRWGRLAKVQAEAHTKLLDRFTGNDELLAYVQSSAGSRFLKSSPISLDGGPRVMGSPVSRILWSMQAGVVLGAAGIGLNYVSRNIDPLHADPVFMFSVLLISIGLGFFASAGLSLVMSKRLGLLGDRKTEDE